MAAIASTSRLVRQAGGHLLSSGRATVYASQYCPTLLDTVTQVRHSHIGSMPLDKPAEAKLEILPLPPHPSPGRPLIPTLRRAQTMVVSGPKGLVVLPLHHCVVLKEEALELQRDADNASSPTPAAAATQPTPSTTAAHVNNDGRPTRVTLSLRDEASAKRPEKATWGLTRKILDNAFVGVTEGHTTLLRLVGVGYRAALELDPLARQSKLDKALAARSYFISPEAKEVEIARDNQMKELAAKRGPNMRLNIRLGYSHPVILPIPHGITCQVPQPTKIILTGADREALGNFASSIRKWRVPEPYKGKGIFVDNEIVRLKTVKKK